MVDNSVEVRSLRSEQLDGLCASWNIGRIHKDHFARQLLGIATYLIAWRADEPLGSVVVQWNGCIGPNAKKAYPQVVELNHLQVRDNFRGHGVGSELINAAEELACRPGNCQMGVSVADNNHDARRLYLRLGYRPSGVFDVSEYDWVSEDGQVHRAVERNQLLVKVVAVRKTRTPAGRN